MSTSSFESHSDIIDLQQQVARLQALLEVSRQVHAAVGPEEVLQSVLRIVVRELEMTGAHVTDPPLTIGEMPDRPGDDCASPGCVLVWVSPRRQSRTSTRP